MATIVPILFTFQLLLYIHIDFASYILFLGQAKILNYSWKKFASTLFLSKID